jgi:hypothetical protein
VQIYSDTGAFIDSLVGFVASGIRTGESVLFIATAPHRLAIEMRLKERGIDVDRTRASDRYIDLDAADVLAEFMVDGWPDDELFAATIRRLLDIARRDGRRVRAFGEMVAILWARGEHAATVRLEHLWHNLCHSDGFSLYCAYPRVGFTRDAETSIAEICAAHSRVITG